MLVDFRPEKQDADAGVQPQHQDHDGGQAAVHIRIITEIVEVDGKSVGTSDPSDGGNQRTGKLETDILPFIGQPGVQRDEKERQQRQCKKRPETNQAGNESVQHRKVTE